VELAANQSRHKAHRETCSDLARFHAVLLALSAAGGSLRADAHRVHNALRRPRCSRYRITSDVICRSPSKTFPTDVRMKRKKQRLWSTLVTCMHTMTANTCSQRELEQNDQIGPVTVLLRRHDTTSCDLTHATAPHRSSHPCRMVPVGCQTGILCYLPVRKSLLSTRSPNSQLTSPRPQGMQMCRQSWPLKDA